MKVLVVIAAVCALLLAACAPRGEPELEVRRELDVSGVTVSDVFAPRDGDRLPVVVMLHGTGGERDVMEPLARAVAERGVVVYLPDWPVIDQVAAFPADDDEPFRRQAEAVVCALRYARRTAAEFGGDPDDLTVVGHSGGATAGARVALVDEPVPWPGIDCDRTLSHRPERFIATGGDFLGWYQYATECPDLFEPYNPMTIEPTNVDLEVRLIHGFYDTAVDARVSALFDERLAGCGIDSAFIGTDTGHSELRDPSMPAGRFVVDQVDALVHGSESVFDRSTGDAFVEFTGDGACRYDGPAQVPRGELLRIEVTNETAGELLWFALARLRPEVPVSLEDLRADRTSSGARPPAFVSYGSFSSVPAGSTRDLDWVFVDSDARWAVYCMRDPNPAAPMTWPSFSMWGGPELRAAAIISSGG